MRSLVAGALAAGAFLLATPADAGCYGTREVIRVCYALPEVRDREISQCVYTGGDDCEKVTVPFVTIVGELDVWCVPGTNSPDSLTTVCAAVDRVFAPPPQR